MWIIPCIRHQEIVKDRTGADCMGLERRGLEVMEWEGVDSNRQEWIGSSVQDGIGRDRNGLDWKYRIGSTGSDSKGRDRRGMDMSGAEVADGIGRERIGFERSGGEVSDLTGKERIGLEWNGQ